MRQSRKTGHCASVQQGVIELYDFGVSMGAVMDWDALDRNRLLCVVVLMRLLVRWGGN